MNSMDIHVIYCSIVYIHSTTHALCFVSHVGDLHHHKLVVYRMAICQAFSFVNILTNADFVKGSCV